ncbi:hypothetical protein FQZ97_1050600 [compost metagenome]
MLRTGLQLDVIVEDIGVLDAQHALPGIGGELREASGLVGPGVPQHRRACAAAAQLDTPLPGWVDDAQLCRGIQVDTVGFAAKAQCAALLALQPVVQGVYIAAARQPLDVHLANVADREVAVQRLAQRQWRAAEVAAAELKAEVLIEADAQVQFGGVRPAW